MRITVQGHTDRVGGLPYNYDLGKRRAEAVATRVKELIDKHAGRLPAGTVDSIAYDVE